MICPHPPARVSEANAPPPPHTHPLPTLNKIIVDFWQACGSGEVTLSLQRWLAKRGVAYKGAAPQSAGAGAGAVPGGATYLSVPLFSSGSGGVWYLGNGGQGDFARFVTPCGGPPRGPSVLVWRS